MNDKDFEKQMSDYEKYNLDRQRRISHAKEYKYYSLDSYVFLYESGPMDHYERWKPLNTFGYVVHEESMSGKKSNFDLSIEKKISKMEKLLISGLMHYSNILINDIRGELMHFCHVDVDEENMSYCDVSDSHLIICIKGDSNGTMYAFSDSPYLAKNIPHDFGYEWVLMDAHLTQFKKTAGTKND